MHTAPWKLQLCCTLTSGRCYDLSYDWTQEMFFWVLKAVHSQRWNWIMCVLVKATLGTVSKPRATTCPRGEIQEWRGHNDKGLTWHPGTVDVTLCRRRETGWELCYSSLTERQRPTLLASCLEEHNASGSVTVVKTCDFGLYSKDLVFLTLQNFLQVSASAEILLSHWDTHTQRHGPEHTDVWVSTAVWVCLHQL